MKIEELTLYSANLAKQKQFYSEVLELPCIASTPDSVIFKAGSSRLTLREEAGSHPVHFALIIPGNSFLQAHNWLKNRVTLLPFEGEEIIDFPNWNAKSQYFYDADRNIVEFIARRDVASDFTEPFSPASIVQVGEVGLPAENLEALYLQLNHMRPLPRYSGDFKRFAAAGSPEGLFILVNPDQKKWFPADDEVRPAHLCVRGDFNFEYKNEKIIALK